MNCRDCMDRLLLADPKVIALAIGSPAAGAPAVLAPQDLLDHLGACGSCRSAARRVLEGQSELASGLEALRPIRSLSDAVSEARREVARGRNRRRRHTWAIAAAVVVGLLGIRVLDPGSEARRGAGGGPVSAGHPEPPGTEVEALLDESVLVLETENENVVVYWFYQGRKQ